MKGRPAAAGGGGGGGEGGDGGGGSWSLGRMILISALWPSGSGT